MTRAELELVRALSSCSPPAATEAALRAALHVSRGELHAIADNLRARGVVARGRMHGAPVLVLTEAP